MHAEQKSQIFGSLDRCAAGFEPLGCQEARFNQPTAQLAKPSPKSKEGLLLPRKRLPGERARGLPGKSSLPHVMSSTLSANFLKMAAGMHRVIGHLGCSFDFGGHIRDGISWLPKIVSKICRSGKTLW